VTTILFFDDWWLESRFNIVRKIGEPQWVPEATLEDPLTAGVYNFPTVYRDPENDKWRALYSGVVLTEGQPDLPFLMLAESDDGVHWTKPNLSKVLAQEPRLASNQVHVDTTIYDRGPVYFDPHPSDPRQRLKMMCVFERRGQNGARIFTQRLGFSPDGIHWTVEDRFWQNRYCSDSPYPIFYNARRNVYTICMRPGQAERRIVQVDTRDFQTFSPPRRALSPDPSDPPLLQFYGMPVFPYEGMFVGLLWLMHCDPTEIKLWKRRGPIDAQLTYSYDGVCFNRTFRQAFIRRNPRGEHGAGCVYPTSMVQDDDGNIRIYSGTSYGEHYQKTGKPDAALLMHTLRRDGFMYLESYSYTGTIMTRCLHLREPLDLRLNVRAPEGQVRVQLSDREGQPLAGYTFDECTAFTGDTHFWQPAWCTGGPRARLTDDVGRIEVELRNAELYAIRGNFEWMSLADVRGFRPDESQIVGR